MASSDRKMDISQIRAELQQIIIEVIGDDLHVVPEDIPILDLGVSSMALVEGMRQVYDRFGVLVSIRRVIEGQVTLGGLALYIEQELETQQNQKKRAQTALRKWKIQREVPLAPSQQHIGFLSRYSSEAAAAFNEALLVRLEGPLDGPAIQAAVEAVGNKYEALRTALSQEHNTLIVGSGEALDLVVTPVTSAQLGERLAEIVSRPFESGKRLFRAELLRISDSEHVLALVGHALLLDHQALIPILDDIAGLYRAFSQDLEAEAEALALQWTDYLAMGETAEAKGAQQAAGAYWQGVFAAGVPRLELPTDLPRPAVKKYTGARLAVRLEPDLDERLRSSASAEGISMQALLLAAYTAFLHRLSDTGDLVVGVESEPLYLETNHLPVIAPTRNLIPFWSRFDPLRSFREHMHSQAEALAGSQAYRHLSLAELIQLLHLPRDQSRSALFTVAFRSWTQEGVHDFAGLKSAYLIPPCAGARYDLELIAVTMEANTWLVCDYSTELFTADTISAWLHGMLAFLQSALDDAGQACGLLRMMPPDEREKILFEWNRTEKSFPRERTVLDLILEQVQARPNATAIRFGETSLSYGALLERLETIACALQARGIQKGDRVGILLKRGLDLIPAMLASWRLGARYVPMDIGFPQKRLAFMQEEAGLKAVLTNRELISRMAEEPETLALCLEDLGESDGAPTDLLPPAGGADSAIIFFTSGSTGKPKGVEIRHRALLNSLLALRDHLEFTPESTMLALTTISFDVSTNELFMPLLSGGCVDLGEDGLVADGLQLVERFDSRKPSHVQATASTWKAVLTAGWQGDRDICLSSCGEALSRDLAERLLEKCRVLWNWYGPTETTVYSAAYRVVSSPGRPMRIGRPFPNTQLYILDSRLQPVPIGAVGDLYISGEGLALGYWQKPELTRERFIDHPFLPGEHMYRTGDLARYLPDGDMVCLGRVDDQVKIHGVRVELGEVEVALREVEGVSDAVVVSWQDIHGDRQLVGHVIALGPGSLTAAEVRTRLRQRLPEVMIPPYILFAEAFPQTANGKVHRASLPGPDAAGPNPAQGALEAPSTPTEKMLAKAWADVLGIDLSLIGRDSDFMDLGGHSLLMTLLMLEVRKLFQVSFNLREFFGASSLRRFAALIDERRHQQDGWKEAGRSSRSKRSSEWSRQRMTFLQREAQLPLHIAPERGLTFQPPAELGSVFLTGATGFLGAYIVSEILKTTRAELFCLVRPKHGEDGKGRIEKQMRRYEVWQENDAWQSAWDDRVHVVEGDVTLPRMGLTDGVYETLAREVDAIFHGAAHVNFIYPYEALRATNLLGIHEIIRFAFHSRMKPVHHLSTAAIWPMGAEYTYYEKDPIDHYGLLNLGYDEAKWVGEKCLLNAAERGLPVARYRPGEVGGDSLTGHCVTDHFIVACFKGFLQFGALPKLDIEIDVAPVDYVAKAMVYLASRRNPLGRAFHLTNPTRRRMTDALVYLRALGYQFDELPFEELRDRLVASPDFASNALFAYQAALDDMDNVSMQLPTYDTRETQRELEGSGIVCAPADEKLFGRYLRYLQEIGFISPPERLSTHLVSQPLGKERV